MSNSFRAGFGQALILLAAAAAALALAYTAGRAQERLHCKAAQAGAQIQGQAQVITQARTDIQRATRTGQAREADRAHVDAFFNRLAEESRHAPPDPVDRCVLPAERLRLWAAANAGPTGAGAASGQHDSATPGAAAAPLGLDARPGGQPPGGGASVPPAGQPALPAARAPADPSRRLQGVHDYDGTEP